MDDNKQIALKGVMIYFENLPAIQALDDSDAGKLFKAILEYGYAGVIPSFEGTLAIAWSFIQPRLDTDRENYIKKTIDNRYATYKRWSKDKDNILDKAEWIETNASGCTWMHMDTHGNECIPIQHNITTTQHNSTQCNVTSTQHNTNNKKRESRTHFVKPTLDDVKSYITETNSSIDPETFYSYYQACGWMINKKPMKDWKASIRYWERNQKNFDKPKQNNTRRVLTAEEYRRGAEDAL